MRTALLWLSMVTLAAALMFGGATRQGLASDAIPELVALPLIALAWPNAWPSLKGSPGALALLIGVIALPSLQLIPLPPALWTLLPGRGIVVDLFAAAGAPLGWRPISLIPSATWRSLLSLLPFVAVFLGAVSLDREARKALLLLCAAIGVVSGVLAMFQVLEGPTSALYFYAYTNFGRGVGFFANANHFAAFEYAALPLAAAALTGLRVNTPALPIAVVGGVAPVLLLGLSLSGSRTAIGFGAVSAALSLAFLLSPAMARLGRFRAVALVAVFAAVLLPLAMGLGLSDIFARFAGRDLVEDARWAIGANAWRGVVAFFPVGAGIGVFPEVYPLHESASDLIPALVNRAHDDALETLFEGGAASLVLILGFLVWLARATYRNFVRSDVVQSRQARAGAIAMWLLLAHSLWDYPLRTIGLGAVFGLCAALQGTPPPVASDYRGFRWPERRRHRRRIRREPPVPIATPVPEEAELAG